MDDASGAGRGTVSVIAIDTASRTSAWVLRTAADGTVLERCEVPGGELDRRLPGALAGVLTGDVTAVVVLSGPGSYSGVRAGMAAALGLADARRIPLHGLGNLAAVAAAAQVAGGRPFRAVADAGRGGVYVAHFERRDAAIEQVSPVVRMEAGDVDRRLRLFATAVIPGLVTELLDPVEALAAAIPRALAAPPLVAAGLSAIHADAAGRRPAGPGLDPSGTAR
jgi:tRNA threonylcarbamoyladenosine biosynthesis protein TsaB